jgi:hypothetical protein
MQVGHRSIILYIKTLVLQFKALLVRRVLEELYRNKQTVRLSPKQAFIRIPHSAASSQRLEGLPDARRSRGGAPEQTTSFSDKILVQ